jgi:hypothetical protein
MLQCCHVALRQEIPDQNRPVCWSIVVKNRPSVGSPFFRAFPSYRIPNVTKDVSVHFLLTVGNPVIYTTEYLYIIPAYSGKILKLLLILFTFHTFYTSSPSHLPRFNQPCSTCWR